MTPVPGPHLSPDDIDRWLDGTLPAPRLSHLDACQDCLELARTEREMADLIAALPLMAPGAGFSDRVMQSVKVPDPFAIRSLSTVRQRLFGSRRSVAVAAGFTLLLLGSMAGSIVWTLGNQDTLAAIGSWLLAQGSEAAWIAIRGVATNLIEQPWYQGVRTALADPSRLAVASAAVSLAYLAGLLALRRLLALPSQQVAHAGI